jgi:hypothetical protein
MQTFAVIILIKTGAPSFRFVECLGNQPCTTQTLPAMLRWCGSTLGGGSLLKAKGGACPLQGRVPVPGLVPAGQQRCTGLVLKHTTNNRIFLLKLQCIAEQSVSVHE